MISSADVLHGKILIVDDQEANVLLLEQMLRGAGYDTISSTLDSTQVCELHLINGYDLILLDLQMPGMDGFQVMENLKEIETGGYLPVLVITAQPDHKLRALKAGARDFVSKPFDLSEVLIRVFNMLEVRLLHLETLKLYNRVVAEQKVSERLLLKTASPVFAAGHPGFADVTLEGEDLLGASTAEVSVLFSDILEFTQFAESASAPAMMGVLQDIADRFDAGAGTSGLSRSKTIGEAYLATTGLPDAVADHTIRAAHMAVDLAEALDRFNEHSRFKVKVRIGLEAGAGAARGSRKRNIRYDM